MIHTRLKKYYNIFMYSFSVALRRTVPSSDQGNVKHQTKLRLPPYNFKNISFYNNKLTKIYPLEIFSPLTETLHNMLKISRRKLCVLLVPRHAPRSNQVHFLYHFP